MSAFQIKLNNEDLGITPLENIFINHYMLQAPGEYVKVYILGLKYAHNPSNSTISDEDIAKALNLNVSEIKKAWDYWEKMGIIKKNNDAIEFYNIKEILLTRDNKTPNNITVLSPKNLQNRAFLSNIERMVGRPLSFTEIQMIIDWMQNYKFTEETVNLLISYCLSKSKNSFKYMEKVALSWYQAGIRTAEDVEEYLKREDEKWDNYRKIMKFLGLKDTELTEPHIEKMDKWFFEWGFDLEVVLEACKTCILKLNKPNFIYIDKILSNWHKEGIKSIEDIHETEKDLPKSSKKSSKTKPKTPFHSSSERTYDMEELERRLLAYSRGELIENE